MNIDISSEHQAELYIYENDSACEIAQTFIKQNKLPFRLLPTLAKKIEEYINLYHEKLTKKLMIK